MEKKERGKKKIPKKKKKKVRETLVSELLYRKTHIFIASLPHGDYLDAVLDCMGSM